MRKTNSYSCLLLPQSTEITVICHYFPPEYSREGKRYFIKFNMMMVKIKDTKYYCLLMSIPWGIKNHVYKTGRTGAILLVLSNPTSSLTLHTQKNHNSIFSQKQLSFSDYSWRPFSHFPLVLSYQLCVSHLSASFQSRAVSYFTFTLFPLHIQSNVH